MFSKPVIDLVLAAVDHVAVVDSNSFLRTIEDRLPRLSSYIFQPNMTTVIAAL